MLIALCYYPFALLALTNDHTLTHTLPCRLNPGALGPGLRINGSLSSASAMACSLPMGDVIGTSPEIPGGPLVNSRPTLHIFLWLGAFLLPIFFSHSPLALFH